MKPNEYYIGVSEFISVIVPGFLVTIAAAFFFADYTVIEKMNVFTGSILAVTSYVIGQILFAIGAWWDELYEICKPKGNEELIEKIRAIREQYKNKDCPHINMYQWCRAVLSAAHPAGHIDVLRKEADSKLFRSLVIPLLVFSAAWFASANPFYGILSIMLAGLAFWRFRAQRFKACRIAYTQVITLFTLGKI